MAKPSLQSPPTTFPVPLIRADLVLDAAGGTNIYMLEETAALNYLLPPAARQLLDSLQNYQGFPNQVPNPPPVTDLEFVERNTFHWGPRRRRPCRWI